MGTHAPNYLIRIAPAMPKSFIGWIVVIRSQMTSLYGLRTLLGKPKNLLLIDGDADVFGDGSVTLISAPGHTPGHQSLLVHLRNSGFIMLSGDVVHLQENFAKNVVPSLNTNKAESIASMERVRRLIATYKAKFFINHDKRQSDKLKLLPAFYD